MNGIDPAVSEERYAWPEMVREVAEAVPSVVCPVTVRAPAVADDAYKFVEVAFVEEEFVATRVVAVADVNVASVAVSVERVARVAEREEKNPVVVVLLVAVRLVITALVVVALPTMRSVMVASVATREAMKELVEVLSCVVSAEIVVVAR